MKNNIRTVANFLSADECESVLKRCLADLILVEGKTYSEKTKKFKDLRRSKVASIENLGSINDRIFSEVNKNVSVKGFEPFIESFQFTKYSEGDYFDWHTDSNDTIYRDRFYTVVIPLNEEYKGGEFQLLIENKETEMRQDRGNLFIFPANTTHRVKQIASGTRYSLVSWLKLKPTRDHEKSLL
jgi:PKHD-type hydroxylase